jgi:hypothetical protein
LFRIRRKIVTGKAKFVLIALVAALGIAAPAHARNAVRPVPARSHHHADHRGALRDFAPAPSQSNSNFPAIRMDREDY